MTIKHANITSFTKETETEQPHPMKNTKKLQCLKHQ